MAEAAFNMIAETQRLRDAGLPQEQAEAVTLAIHAGVTGGVATRADVEALRGDVRRLDTRIDDLGDRLDTKIDGLGDRLDARIDALDTKIDGLGDRLDTRIDALDTKMDGLGDRLDARIDHVEDSLRKDISRLDTKIDAQSDRIILRLGVVIAATAAALLAALRYLPPPG